MEVDSAVAELLRRYATGAPASSACAGPSSREPSDSRTSTSSGVVRNAAGAALNKPARNNDAGPCRCSISGNTIFACA
mgnify:CR=1 FL=1